ncbi:MAG: aldehyde dehydrogenase (NADP(+)) [Chitinophagaceae bacterium]
MPGTDINDVMQRAKAAFGIYRKKSGKEKADFLVCMADAIEGQRAVLVPLAMEESHLPEARLQGELSRTTGQLKLFAALLREGSWVEASVDYGNPERKPLPKADIRKMLQPVGPVVVFGASNFPFAFSTAGGDSASVLASGSTLVVKGHPAHPKTSQAMFAAMQDAVVKSGMPADTVQHVADASFVVGQALVQHPLTAGVGFTGSYRGGRALMDYAASRRNPIPVFAEMGSVNPVVLYPEILSQKAEAIARQYAGSITVGMGQFCTNPGLILGIKSADLDTFVNELGAAVQSVLPLPMLHQGIHDSYVQSLDNILDKNQVSVIGKSETKPNGIEAYPTVVKTSSSAFLENKYLQEEVFGPYSIVVECVDKDDLKKVLSNLEGQLTSTIMGTENDMADHADVIDLQIALAGRILVNDVPTGVEVCHSMVHGGPYPATSDGRFTSVGTTAIKRWVRPVCYQGFPQQFLPEELKDGNPLQIKRIES